MNVLIVSAGESLNIDKFNELYIKVDILIGVDKGCNFLSENNIIPNYIIGDFDSIDKSVLKKFDDLNVEKLEFDSKKDFSDSEIAINLAISKKAKKLFLVGFTGSRLDHTFSNLSLLKKLLDNNIEATIIDNNNTIFMINKPKTINKDNNYKYISFISYENCVKNLKVSGAKYNLSGYDLYNDCTRTISNEFLDEKICISFESGILMVIYSRD